MPCDSRINRLALVLTKNTPQKYADHMLSVEHGMGERETSSSCKDVSFVIAVKLRVDVDKCILEFFDSNFF